MDFLFLNKYELGALMGLPHIQQVTYLLGIRPYMDRKTFMVGIKRRISYQSLTETLYVEPHQGIKSGSPSRQQVRRIVKSLERAGLIELQSDDMHLILKCKLAGEPFSLQNKADTNPTPKTDTKCDAEKSVSSEFFKDLTEKTDMVKTTKADTPHKVSNYLCVCFEKFWASYPQPQNKAHAWSEFEKLHPDEELFSKILASLDAQISHYQQQQAIGAWVPHWKYPGNWLAQRCWEEDSKANQTRRIANESGKKHSSKKLTDMFWESCKDGADYIPDDGVSCESGEHESNIIEFSQFRKASKAY